MQLLSKYIKKTKLVILGYTKLFYHLEANIF